MKQIDFILENKNMSKEKNKLHTFKRVLLLLGLVFVCNTSYAQQALKIYKSGNSITYINTNAVDSIKFEDALAIGDTIQGGIIFYLDANGEHGLVVALSEIVGVEWCQFEHTDIWTDAIVEDIGAGEENTYKIVKSLGNYIYAATICGDYVNGVYNDWFLPSKDELNLIYTNLHQAGLGSFASNCFWSSTEIDLWAAWGQDFDSGTQIGWPKPNAWSVLPVRAF